MCMNEQMGSLSNWEALRTAYHVARLGTLSGAAEALGVHHATVMRHVDLLEAELGCHLFRRHARGYSMTDAGRDLLQAVGEADVSFAKLSNRLRGQKDAIAGELVVTALPGLSAWLTGHLAVFQRKYPDINVTTVFDERLLKLEYGEAHVAVRAGPRPEDPDNIVRPLGHFKIGMFAHESYVRRYGRLMRMEDIPKHRFLKGIGPQKHSPLSQWVNTHVPAKAVVWESTDARALDDALYAGVGVWFTARASAALRPGLVSLMPDLSGLDGALWLVSHRDISRVAKVQALTRFLLENLPGGLAADNFTS